MKLVVGIFILHIDIHILHTHFLKHSSKLFVQNEHEKQSQREPLDGAVCCDF